MTVLVISCAAVIGHVTPRQALSTMPNNLKDRRRVVRLGRAAVRGNVVRAAAVTDQWQTSGRSGDLPCRLPPPPGRIEQSFWC